MMRDLASERIRWWDRLILCAVVLCSVLPARGISFAYPETLGQGSADWLEGQSNPSITGIQPIPGRQGLLVSYTIPPGDPLAFLIGRSWTYDDAVAAIGFLLQGKPDSARTLLTTLQGLTFLDGTLGFSYQVNSSFVDTRVRTGTLAWVGYAFALYQRVTGDNAFQSSAEKIAVYLRTLQLPSGSLKGGPDVNWVSTEHNIDAYFFYRELFRVTGNAGYGATAEQIKSSLLSNHWVKTRSGGNFLQGLNDPTPSLDANSWGAIFLWAIGRSAEAAQALNYVESNFRDTEAISGSSDRIAGYSPDTRKRTIWLEGTVGVATTYQRIGNLAKTDSILDNVYKLQTTWISQGRWHSALPYSMPRYTNSSGDTFSDLESVASTGWMLITLAVRNGEGRFWDHD